MDTDERRQMWANKERKEWDEGMENKTAGSEAWDGMVSARPGSVARISGRRPRIIAEPGNGRLRWAGWVGYPEWERL
jgi:hypothetical protein